MADPRPGKMTLLEIVQNVLSAMSSDEVNSFGDTVEGVQIADLVKETYYFLINGKDDLFRAGAFRLESVSDTTRPTYLKLPAALRDIECLYYDLQTDSKVTWRELSFIEPEDFIRLSLNNSSKSAAVAVEDYNGGTYYVLNNADPTYYTTLDDEYVILDSWDVTKESTVQEHKTMALGTHFPTFRMEDDFIPDLPAEMFPLLLSEVKKIAFVNLKSVSNSEEQLRARRLRVFSQNDKSRAKKGRKRRETDFGRKPNH